MVEFTERERQVMTRVAKGRSSKLIAQELGLSLDRIERLVGQARRKLGAANRAEAAARWIEQEADRAGGGGQEHP